MNAPTTRRWPLRPAVGVLAALLALAALLPWGTSAGASGPPAPGPYPKIWLHGADTDAVTCRDADGTLLYDAPAWTLEPLLRGPLFAPVVLWLAGAGNAPVLPVSFESTAYPVVWETADDGPYGAGAIEHITGRPQGFGAPTVTSEPMVTCHENLIGHTDFGTFRVTRGLAAATGLDASLIGRTLRFDGEGVVSMKVPRAQFPLTATRSVTTLPTPDYRLYGTKPLPTVTCARLRDGVRLYRGAATTLAPLVRGPFWSPMALYLSGDRIVTPRWQSAHTVGTWRTVDGGPVRSDTLDSTTTAPPSGYAGRSGDAKGIRCSWGDHQVKRMRLTAEAATLLGIPTDVVGRSVELDVDNTVQAYLAEGRFPPR